MPESYFVTMATVSASLGSAIALLAAFALYRLQGLATQLQSDTVHVKDTIGGMGDPAQAPRNREALTQLAATADWRGFVKCMDRVLAALPPGSDIGADGRAWVDRVRASYRQRRDLLIVLCVALVLTAAVMTGALLAIANADVLERAEMLRPQADFAARYPRLAVHGFACCLGSYLVLVWAALRRA